MIKEMFHTAGFTAIVFAPVFMLEAFWVGAGSAIIGALILIQLRQMDKPKPVFHRHSRSHYYKLPRR